MKFTIYKYELVKTGEQSLFKPENMNGTIGQDYLDKLLSVKQLNLSIRRPKRANRLSIQMRY